MRLFVAAWPPPAVAARLGAVPRPAVAGIRWTTADQWHVTLRFLGEVADPVVVTGALKAAWAEAHLPGSAVAVAGPAAIRLNPTILCLPVGGLDAVAGAVAAATSTIGRPPERRPFRGHLTLARTRGRAPSGVLAALPRVELGASWPVEEVTVVASNLGGSGSRYEILSRVPLAVPAAADPGH
jgi:2'-5' RNA ligase